ncbi:hypothetical protein H257_08775 [Aphanomyces astaci]|uniref:Uncharacterized protein n=1 Tax=Aphanomyces astaci TaxID=112090 RepID=W4GE33_APHAT|nr:hypothetical protein H257_08775 [Aphanomyces astaci]ETV77329.1 hypothetical protein H257_08775 [Aphanomyces astaci]|eukprot:XP_009833116.1 hypothetical protein H257_08775 [Aphanomyces astaci]
MRYGEAADEDNDVQDANNELMDKVIEEAGDEAFRVLTNFTPNEFDIIWANKVQDDAQGCFTLTVLKHYQSWEKHAVDFDLKAPTLEKIVVKVV